MFCYGPNDIIQSLRKKKKVYKKEFCVYGDA